MQKSNSGFFLKYDFMKAGLHSYDFQSLELDASPKRGSAFTAYMYYPCPAAAFSFLPQNGRLAPSRPVQVVALS